MDDLLIHNARYIPLVNALGMKKISRNVLALQQCVKTIVSNAHDGELLRAKQYYSLFSLNPQVCRDLLVVFTPNRHILRTCSPRSGNSRLSLSSSMK
jgi:hypothetical protein